MKHFIMTVFAFAMFIPTVMADETYQLRNKFNQGELSYFSVVIDTTGTTQIGPLKNPIDSKVDVVLSYKPTKVSESNEATLEMGLEKMTMKMSVAGMGNTQDMRKMLGLDDTKLTMKTNAVGEVLEPPHFPELAAGGVGGANPGFEKMTEKTPWIKLPEKAVAIGETWTEQRNVPINGAVEPVIADSTFTLKEVKEIDGKQVAVIGTETVIRGKDVTVDPAAMGQALGMIKLKFQFKRYDSDGEGEIRFNMDDGYVLDTEEHSKVEIEVVSDLNVSGAAFPSGFTHKFNMLTTGTYYKTNPVEENKDDNDSGASN